MKKTMVARETAREMHEAEAAVAAAIEATKAAVARMVAAKAELEMTTPAVDAAINGWHDTVALLEQAEATMYAGHRDAYQALQDSNIRGVAFTTIPGIPGVPGLTGALEAA